MKLIEINYSRFFYFIFAPISKLWELIYSIRRFFFDVGIFKKSVFKVPIISIGNLTLGGTGKTPFTLWIGQYLGGKSKKVMVLTRGYKGKLENSSGIIYTGKTISQNPYEFGDEALVLCRGLENASVVVGKRRSHNLKHYFDEELPDVVLLDDGHQHLKISRNLNIVLFDALLPIERYKAPPLGYLREGMTALKDADMVIIGRCDLVPDEKLQDLKNLISKYKPSHCPVGSFYYSPSVIKDSNFVPKFAPEELSGKKVLCVCAIASPYSFYKLVESLGATIVDKIEFNDHHFYTKDELNAILDRARAENAYVITTEKDIVKLRRIIDSTNLYFVEIEIKFLTGKTELEKLIDQVIY